MRIQLSLKSPIPEPVLKACAKLNQNQFKAWLAGGCVRDMILGNVPRDWDIVTDAPTEKIRILFPEHIDVGVAFGIYKLKPIESVAIDIAIFRHEEAYSDHRHPDSISIGDENTDSARRDFTVNALYFDPTESVLVDLVEGRKDLEERIIRSVGNPNKRFTEDALRIIRAIRFCAQLGFKLDRETSKAIRTHKALLSKISRERIREEVFRLLASERPLTGIETLAQHSLWEYVFGNKLVRVPADLRQLKYNGKPKAIDWICSFALMGLMGSPTGPADQITKKVSDLLRLSNEESKQLMRTLQIYTASNNKTGDGGIYPIEWIEFFKENSNLTTLVKSMVRRGRGVEESQKKSALKFIDLCIRWGQSQEQKWPTAQELLSEGFKQSAELGHELRARSWKIFWGLA